MNQTKVLLTRISKLLNIFWYFNIISTSIITLVLLVSIFANQFKGALNIPVNFKTTEIENIKVHDSILHNPGIISDSGSIVLRFEDSNLDYILICIGWFLFMVTWTIIIYQFNQIFKNFKSGFLFVESNLKRTRIVAYVIIIAPILKWILYFPLHRIILNNVTLDKIQLKNHFNYQVLVVGLLILAIVEIFKAGIKLEAEQEYMV